MSRQEVGVLIGSMCFFFVSVTVGCGPEVEFKEGCHTYCQSDDYGLPASKTSCLNEDARGCGVVRCPDDGGLTCGEDGEATCSDGSAATCEEFSGSCTAYCESSGLEDEQTRVLCGSEEGFCGSPICENGESPECVDGEPRCPDGTDTGAPVECDNA